MKSGEFTEMVIPVDDHFECIKDYVSIGICHKMLIKLFKRYSIPL